MKKTIFIILFAFLGIFAKGNAQTNPINISVDLNLGDPLGTDITAFPNSTAFPGNFELRLKVSSMVHSGHSGTYSFSCERRVFGTTSWGLFTPSKSQFPSSGITSTYGQSAWTYQLEGTVYEYRVKVTFSAVGGGSAFKYTPIRKATINGVPTGCFSLYNISSSQSEPSYYGPIIVNNICQYAVSINGSCSKFENAYHIRVAEFNLTTWNFVQDLYNGWAGSGEAPSFISINQLVNNNGFSFASGKVYAICLSVGPQWHSAPIQFFRVLTTCRETAGGNIKELELVNPTELNLYPNPVKDELELTINQDEKLVSYSIFDVTGKIVKEATFSSKSNQQSVNLNDLEKGIYLINIETDKQSYKEKIIKE